ncbi:hypothetical protein [Actinomadura sp. NTSP31]|uniref:hypothetical protein n=1 Tax=Actinomadura sp. NTSP31 TaxID=1735447 RepID=UPI0035C035D2
MELIVTLVVAFPLGFFVRSRGTAYVAYIAVHSFVFSFQNTELVREWSGGDHSAFPKDPGAVPWSYVLANVAIYAAGFGLVTLGHAVRTRLRRRNAEAVDLAH